MTKQKFELHIDPERLRELRELAREKPKAVAQLMKRGIRWGVVVDSPEQDQSEECDADMPEED